ncbi:LuxR C-terminal-related transcriptional regulator [Amycolatopsis endophytica]|uniref:Putative ATPase/DNA-binding CsgD family transcriptional regulator n=1 Tax=Amycolatopsis endophytica TaxID=860233 RepID=A0A853B3I5_9PSEU|nr:LuxR C-terminal-related transcriptional regulator [Amycolatopsis endophytica]NYI89331.1 putative ATPase/DNA-binding CsgD family transcriptional regulator [Amycolatopsis endophytica]
MSATLPPQVTPFVGRGPEPDALTAELAANRLVTVAGPGGCGKTRLALRVAARQDDVCWADLTATADPSVVPKLLAAATGTLLTPDHGSLPRQIGDRRVLVCLDNCEHVLAAAAEVTLELVAACPNVTVLATSREPLGIPGERVWRVPPLSAADAVALFRARSGTGENTATSTLCARLDGIPLAIELAAAWSGTLTVPEILRGLDDRFTLLVRGPRGVTARHQTLAASMAWSHDLLDEPDRVLFRRLGVFRGGFTLGTATGVCGPARMEVLTGLGRLVDKSLVVADTAGSSTRYRMLETVRQYALAKLVSSGEEQDVRERHLGTFLALAEEAEPLLGKDKDARRAIVAADQENLRAAIEFGLAADDPDRGRRLAASLAWLWHLGGRGHEGLTLLRHAIDRGPDGTALQARLLTGLALVADTTQPVEHDAARAALDIVPDDGLATLLHALSELVRDFDSAAALAGRARTSDDGFVRDGATALLGIIHHLRDDHEKAVPLLENAIDGLLRRNDRGVASTALAFLASTALHIGQMERARELATESVRVARPLEDYHRIGSATSVLATIEGTAGRIDEARAVLDPMVRLVDGAESPPFVPGLARAKGYLHLWSGEPSEAIGWFRREADDEHLTPPTLVGLAEALRLAGDREAAATACARALTAARRAGMPKVIADALEQSAYLADDPADLHHEALAIRAERGLWLSCVRSLEALSAHDEPLRHACERARREMGLPHGDVPSTAMSLQDAIAYARRPRGKRGRPASGWESLTPTEESVVRLAVQGLSNPEIGTRLFMSRSTVKTHLSHIYAKLGVTNRTELAAASAARQMT